jgi:hypothetical protein
MILLLLKVVITVAIVSILSVIAERVSPRAAGILSGYPLGSAITLFFIGVEQGADFAGQSAIFNAAGLCALLTFLYLYYQASRRITGLEDGGGMVAGGKISAIALSTLAGLAGFFAVNAVLQQMQLPAWACVVVGAGSIIGFGVVLRKIPNATIRQRVALNRGQGAFRAVVAALVILSVTGAAYTLPPSWAGLLSAFPATVFPLVLIMHTTYGTQQAHTVIKNLPSGLWALLLYSLTISISYPLIGIYWGTLVGFTVATLYLLIFAAVSGRFQGHGAAVQEHPGALEEDAGGKAGALPVEPKSAA